MRKINFRGIENIGIGKRRGGAPSTVITDYDGNVYTSVIIGDQEWLVENLKTTHFNNGDVVDTKYPNGDINNVEDFGLLYLLGDANDIRELTPTGFKIPSNSDYAALQTFLGGENIAGGKMKSTNSLYWNHASPDTNESGFTAVGAGWENGDVYTYFKNINWLITTDSIVYKISGADTIFSSQSGVPDTYRFSIRCMRDI